MKISELLIVTIGLLIPSVFLGNDIEQPESSDTSVIKADTYIHREFLKEMYESVYSHTPSMLGLWEFSEYSHISAGYSYSSGDFRDLQEFRQRNESYIETSSVMNLNKGWTVYGQFGYVNGNSKDVRYNLSYDKDNYGSPYYYIMEAPGDWSYQKYLFSGSFSKELIKGRLYAGASVSYKSTLNFRTVDYRNEQYDLHTSLKPTVTYVMGKYSFSLGADIIRQKREPQIYSRYQQSNAGDEYQLYINTGLGSYIKNAPPSTTSEHHGVGPTVALNFRTPEIDAYINYSLTFNSQDLTNKLTSTISELGDELGQYSASLHRLDASFLRLTGECKGFKISSQAYILKGEASQYSNVSNNFLKNYTRNRYHAFLNASKFNEKSRISKIFVEGSFHSEREFDMNYGQEYSLSNLKVAAGLSASFNLNKAGALSLSGKAGVKTNLDINHDPVSATDIFITTDILYPMLSYYSADSWSVAAEAVWSKFILQRYFADIVLFASLEKPYEINYSNNNTQFDTQDSFGSAGIKLVFNF